MTKPKAWCNCHLDTTPRHCRVCAPERKPTRKRHPVKTKKAASTIADGRGRFLDRKRSTR